MMNNMWSIFKKLFSNTSSQATNQVATKFPQVVVGLVKTVEPHSNANRLRIAQVEVAGQTLKIVCGAPNLAVGQKVPVALVGSVLPNGAEIKAAVIRGESSEGMLCAEDELGLGADHSGILVLPDSAVIGASIDKYLKN